MRKGLQNYLQNPDKLVEAMNKSMEMDERADYLRRGRRLAHMSVDELVTRWSSAFNACVEMPEPKLLKFLGDSNAELALRGICPDVPLVEGAISKLQKEFEVNLAKNPEGTPELRASFRAFFSELITREPQ